MALLKFLKGNYANLRTKAITEGQVLICGDTGEMFVDVAAGKRVKIGDFVVVPTLEALEALDATAVPTSRLYYVEGGNILARSNGSGWTQINKQQTLAQLGGVSSTTYATDKAALVKADTDNATAISNLETYVGTIPTDATAQNIVAYVQERTSGIATDAALEELTGRVTTAEGKLNTLNGADTVEGSVAKALKDAKAYTDEKDTAMDARMDTAEGSITTLTGEESVVGSVKAIAKTYADGKDTAIAAAKAAGDAAQADVDALEAKVGTVANGKTVVGLIGTAQAAADAAQDGVNTLSGKIGTVAEGKTVVKMIEDAQTAATYDDTALKARVKANEDAITVLNGTGEGSVSKQVADAVAGIVAEAPEAYDTLKEISDWISSHASDASGMNSQINTNKTNIASLTALVGTLPETATSATVIGYIDEAIAALNIGNYAKANDLAAAVTRIGTAEGKITTLEGQVATINGNASTAGSIAKAAADTLASAKTYADGLNTAMDTRVKAIENKNISNGANKVEASTTNGNIKIDGVETVVYTHPDAHTISEVTGLQGALDAKATVTALNAEVDRAKAAEGANDTAIKANATEIAKKANSADVYTKTETYTKDEVDALLTWDSF